MKNAEGLWYQFTGALAKELVFPLRIDMVVSSTDDLGHLVLEFSGYLGYCPHALTVGQNM